MTFSCKGDLQVCIARNVRITRSDQIFVLLAVDDIIHDYIFIIKKYTYVRISACRLYVNTQQTDPPYKSDLVARTIYALAMHERIGTDSLRNDF